MKLILEINGLSPRDIIAHSEVSERIESLLEDLKLERPGSSPDSLRTVAIQQVLTNEVSALLDSIDVLHIIKSYRVEEP